MNRKPDRRLQAGIRGVSKFPSSENENGAASDISSDVSSVTNSLHSKSLGFASSSSTIGADVILDRFIAGPPGNQNMEVDELDWAQAIRRKNDVQIRAELLKRNQGERKPPKEIKRIKRMRQSLSESMLRKGLIRDPGNNRSSSSKLRTVTHKIKKKMGRSLENPKALGHNNVLKKYENISAFDRSVPEQQTSMHLRYHEQVMKRATRVKPLPVDPLKSDGPLGRGNQWRGNKHGGKNGKRNGHRRWKNKNKKAASDGVAYASEIRPRRGTQDIFKRALQTLDTTVQNADTEALRVARLVSWS
jgi:hypothetical protein